MSKQELPTKSEFGTMLRAWRKERGMSQKDLARASGVLGGHISLLERGYWHPGSLSITRLSRALGMEESEVKRLSDASKENYCREDVSGLSETDSFSITTYLPLEVAQWYRAEAIRRKVSRSQLIGAMLLRRYADRTTP